MLSYSHLLQLLDSAPMLHYPHGHGVSGQRCFYYLPKVDKKKNRPASLHYHYPFFSILPSHQVVNAKKKIKKKRYINSGTVSVSSEIRAGLLKQSPARPPLVFHSSVSSF